MGISMSSNVDFPSDDKNQPSDGNKRGFPNQFMHENENNSCSWGC